MKKKYLKVEQYSLDQTLVIHFFPQTLRPQISVSLHSQQPKVMLSAKCLFW